MRCARITAAMLKRGEWLCSVCRATPSPTPDAGVKEFKSVLEHGEAGGTSEEARAPRGKLEDDTSTERSQRAAARKARRERENAARRTRSAGECGQDSSPGEELDDYLESSSESYVYPPIAEGQSPLCCLFVALFCHQQAMRLVPRFGATLMARMNGITRPVCGHVPLCRPFIPAKVTGIVAHRYPLIASPTIETSVVATAGGNSICFIDCKHCRVTMKSRPAGNTSEEFYALAWTVLPDTQRRVVLAAGGKAPAAHTYLC